MGRQSPTRVVTGAVIASMAVHAGLFVLSLGLAVGIEDGSAHRVQAGPPMLIAWADEPDSAPITDPPPKSAEPEPEPEPPPEPAPEPEEIERLRLGIAESALDTENWIGFADPTPHEARKADVVQPALDPNAGPGASAGQPMTPSAAAAPAAGEQGQSGQEHPPAPLQPVQEPTPQPAATQAHNAREPEQPEDRPSVDGGGRDKQQPTEPSSDGTPQPEVEDPDSPMLVEGNGEIEQLAAELRDGFVGPPFEASDAPTEELQSAVAAASPPPSDAAPPGNPGEPGPINTPAAQLPGGTPGEKSERESDATSLKDPINVRLGRPAAAEGLEIVTKRPEFSVTTQLTSYPSRNPRLKVTFNREGRVSKAQFIEPTGLSDIDAPVLHAVYRWTARGEALAKLPAGDAQAGLSITVTILLR